MNTLEDYVKNHFYRLKSRTGGPRINPIFQRHRTIPRSRSHDGQKKKGSIFTDTKQNLRELQLNNRKFTLVNSRDVPTYGTLDRILVSTNYQVGVEVPSFNYSSFE
jgi:hypothetical protein